jgi:hypothetical protein
MDGTDVSYMTTKDLNDIGYVADRGSSDSAVEHKRLEIHGDKAVLG